MSPTRLENAASRSMNSIFSRPASAAPTVVLPAPPGPMSRIIRGFGACGGLTRQCQRPVQEELTARTNPTAPSEAIEPPLQGRWFVEHLDDLELSSIIESPVHNTRVIDAAVIDRRRLLLEQTVDEEHPAIWLQRSFHECPERVELCVGHIREPETEEDGVKFMA